MILTKDKYLAAGGLYKEIPDFEAVERVAEGVVDALLYFGLTKGQLTDTDPMWGYVEKAIALQIDTIQQAGGLEAYLNEGHGNDVASESISEGGVSQSMTYLAGGERDIHAAGLRASKRAVALLGSVGLIYRMRIVPGGIRR